ncbi:T9SS type A sorting domain-containing protein [Phaeodactylibacter xiamenensis]|uniref:T9SS type A sorting domain-containing protein n=1 Tax=Phaeodactylibacter xiamenensis TaxID=1524460 RepID=UPI003CCBBBAF
MNLRRFYLFFALLFGGILTNANAQCSVGALLTNGSITITCDENDFFDLELDGTSTIPATGGLGWEFSDALGGTGGLAGGFTITNSSTPNSFDASLNGIMPANNLNNLSGTWLVKGVVYEDAGDPLNTVCATTTDSLIIDFLSEESPVITSLVDNEDGSATVEASGGTEPYTYLWSDGQTTATATGLTDAVYTVTVTGANGCTTTGEVAVGNAVTCQVGVLTTAGEVSICTADGTFDVATDGTETIPSSGGFGWVFYNALGGTGALGGDFILTNSPASAAYDADLNGVLSGNNFPAFSGTWVIKGAVYEDAGNAFNSICSLTSDSLIVNFGGTIAILELVDNGDGSATVTAEGGTPPYTYMWSDGQEGQTAVGLEEGSYTVTVTDADGCSASESVSIGGGAEPCLDWMGPNPGEGWIDFNSNFGGAPCDDGSGCPFNEITDFEVFASEAYSVDGFQEGGTYTFSMCNGPGAGSWVPEFTIIAPSGEVDAFGAGDGDACSITWTASESGTYLIVINEAGSCGGGDNIATSNGFPALTCTGGPEVACPVISCAVGELATTGETVVCGPEGTFTIETDGTDTIPETGGFGWQLSDALGGTGGLAGGFTLTGSNPSSTFDADLNGVMSSNNLDPLGGTWVFYGVVYTDADNATGTICGTTTDSLIVTFNPELLASAVDNEDGTATVTAEGGTPPYAYEWSDGQTTATATGLMEGVASVTVTDSNGCTAVTEVEVISSVGVIKGLNSLYLGPNPTNGQLTVQLELDQPKVLRLEVVNTQGQIVQRVQAGKNAVLNHSFDFSNRADGLYFIRIIAGDDEVTRRIVVTK